MELNTFRWASTGIEPLKEEDAVYNAGDQPIAGYDNFVMWTITEDLHNLRDHTTNHATEHQSGGSQTINLDGLTVGTTLTFEDDEGDFSLTDGDTTALTISSTGPITTMPDFGTQTQHTHGLASGGDIERTDGSVIYDHTTDYFHRAENAQHADTADLASNANNLGGDPPGAFLQPGDNATITGEWAFNIPINADINGRADEATYATNAGHADSADEADNSQFLRGLSPDDFANVTNNETITGNWTFEGDVVFNNKIDASVSYADNAGHADSADWADEAGNAQTLQGYGVSDFARKASNETITGNWTFTKPATFDQTIVGSIEHAETADLADQATNADNAGWADQAQWSQNSEYSQNSNRLDGYHAQDLIDMMNTGGEGRWTVVTTDTVTTSDDTWSYSLGGDYDQYRVILITETTGSSVVRMRINDDTRYRYRHFKHNRLSNRDPEYQFHDQTGWYWPINRTRSGFRAKGEYILSTPPAIDTTLGADRYPMMAVKNYTAHPQASGGTPYWGYLETDYNSIDSIQMHNFQSIDPTAAAIIVEGANFPNY